MPSTPFRRKRQSDFIIELLVAFLSFIIIIMMVTNIVFLRHAGTAALSSNNEKNHIHQAPQLHDNPNKQNNKKNNVSNKNNKKNNVSNKNKKKSEDRDTVEIFRQAGIKLSQEEINDLPSWDDIVALIGNSPIVHGLETCTTFRNTIPAVERNLGAAGMFNSGTNLVTQLLKQNCKIPQRVQKYGIQASKEAHGIRWQVSWGKHTPAHFKWEHATNHAKNISKETILPIVTIRNPYNWMASMCRNGYTAVWNRNEQNCPHLVEKKHHVEKPSIPTRVNVTYAEQRTSSHSSLAHLWNDWNGEYLDANYPRLVVRFEDLIFYPLEVTTQICQCAGGELQLPFTYIRKPAKTGPGHGKVKERTGMVQAWMNYGKPLQPQGGFSKTDYDASKQFLNFTMMEIFGYSHPPPIK